ncbi:hypothetical protein BD324DRAFT_647709 [Kockovaella imperatae]|uniref:Uncharacterized protein n=1 Tax=Kockovaella imperatae TaxID=4999 RepID=A0A1Y1URY5_9TREE|nr:hypothetical protein BD324DRAFT_647709 [Kockovaella imperatae]ORX40801.1 hypothetical protein BD324DRAFT_647709 [Kockovaella imperatae]
MLLVLPSLLTVLFIFPVAQRVSLFKLDIGSTEHSIGAQGYKVRGGQWTSSRFAYPAPDDWPKEIDDLPIWLLFHLILGILIGVYFLILCLTFAFEKGSHKTMAILEPFWWSRVPALLLAALSVALASRDAAFWGQAAKVSRFRADALGIL